MTEEQRKVYKRGLVDELEEITVAIADFPELDDYSTCDVWHQQTHEEKRALENKRDAIKSLIASFDRLPK